MHSMLEDKEDKDEAIKKKSKPQKGMETIIIPPTCMDTLFTAMFTLMTI